MMDGVVRDLRFAFRLIGRTPAVSVATILTLALGVGLNAGVFTVVNGMLFRPRVTADPGSFVHLQPVYSGPGAPRYESPQLSTADYRALRDSATTVRPLAAWAVVHTRIGADAGDALSLLVSCNFFDVYGLDHVARGRTFRPEECEPPAAPVAVISDRLWRRHFAADPDVLGKPLLLNRIPFVIVGVTPPDFPGQVRGEGIWIPYTNQAALRQGVSIYDDPGVAWLWAEGRLRPGTSREAAQAELNVLMRRQDALHTGRTTAIALTNGAMIHEPQIAPVAVFVVPLVLGSVGLVLLIACGNVALLLLARALARRREITVRLALGCSRARLLRMLLTESILLAALGVPVSAWIAWQAPLAMRALIPMMPFYPMRPDAAVFSYLAAATIAAGLAAGATPAMESLRQRLTVALGAHDALFGSASRVRNLLIAGQVGMSVVLLAGTALLLRVEQSLLAPDPEIDAAHLLVANYDPPASASAALLPGIEARLAAIAGVRSVAYARAASDEAGGEGTVLTLRGASAVGRRIAMNVVSASYFDTLNRRIVQGRALAAADAHAPVVRLVVSETLASQWWPHGGAVGALLDDADRRVYEVVGVVRGDVALAGGSFDPMQAYTLAGGAPPGGQLLLRFDGDVKSLQTSVRDVLRDLGPSSSAMPTTLAAARSAMASRFLPLVDMVGALGGTAIVLAMVGIYGVVSFAVSRRTREIGIRIALGATGGDVTRLILSTGLRPIAFGLAGGFVLVVPGAIALSRVFERTPVPLRAGDPLPYLVVATVLSLAALATMLVPARRAAAVAPSVSLRSE
jgi:predicted permease